MKTMCYCCVIEVHQMKFIFVVLSVPHIRHIYGAQRKCGCRAEQYNTFSCLSLSQNCFASAAINPWQQQIWPKLWAGTSSSHKCSNPLLEVSCVYSPSPPVDASDVQQSIAVVFVNKVHKACLLFYRCLCSCLILHLNFQCLLVLMLWSTWWIKFFFK